MSSKIKQIAGLTLFLIPAFQVTAQSFRLGTELQSNMVIQQNKPLLVWGDAAPGSIVEVQADWTAGWQKDTADNKGHWQLQVPVPAAIPGEANPQNLRVRNNDKELNIQNVLIGDVWFCSGQSNMDMQLKPFLPWLLGTMHYQQEIANAYFPAIRLFDLETNFSATPLRYGKGQWTICSPQTVADFSAVAYFFARDLYLKRRIPIGLVVSSIGASTAQAWTSRDSLQADRILNEKYLYPYDTSARAKEVIDATVTFDKVARPTLLYNAMIHPLRHISLSGFLWYQGESNRHDGAIYTRLMAAMIRNWRNLFGQGDLPFYYVQVAPYNWQENNPEAFEYAVLREAQSAIRSVVPAAEMVVTMDIADPNDIHPRNKQDVGYRLAQIALAKQYGFNSLVHKGPEYESVQTKKDTLIVSFKMDGLGSGLGTSDGQAPQHFYVAGKDKKFYPATATIRNNQVLLLSDKVKNPIAVRYAFTNYPVTNFGNIEGFPALPFRSSF